MDEERPFRDLLSLALLMAALPPAPRDPGPQRTQHGLAQMPATPPGQKRS
jgi:hypothetical protein